MADGWSFGSLDGDSYGVYSLRFAPLSSDDISVEITGIQTVGETLTAELTGINADDTTLEIQYSWIVDGVIVATTATNTFLLTFEHAGETVTAIVEIHDTFFTDPGLEISTLTSLIDYGSYDATDTINLACGSASGWDIYESGDTVIADGTGNTDIDGVGTFFY